MGRQLHLHRTPSNRRKFLIKLAQMPVRPTN